MPEILNTEQEQRGSGAAAGADYDQALFSGDGKFSKGGYGKQGKGGHGGRGPGGKPQQQNKPWQKQPGGGGCRGGQRSDEPCGYCGKPGHSAEDCHLKRKHQEGAARHEAYMRKKGGGTGAAAFVALEEAVSTEVLLLASAQGIPSNWLAQVWYVDSGATQHVTNNLASLDDFEDLLDEERWLRWGDGRQSRINGKGRAVFRDRDGSTTLVLDDVYYVPSSDVNLISVKRITARGGEVVFKGDSCHISSAAGSAVCTAVAKGSGLYPVYNYEHGFGYYPEPQRVLLATSSNEPCCPRELRQAARAAGQGPGQGHWPGGRSVQGRGCRLP